MGVSTGRAIWRDFKLLLLPVAIALLMAMAFAVQAALADHGGTHVGIVDTHNPDNDLGLVPMEFENIGDTRDIDLYVRVPNALEDDMYAGEFHLSIEPRGIVTVLDGQAEYPGANLDLAEEGLALTPLERLRLPIEGFPENPGVPKNCVSDAVPLAGDDSDYTFIKQGLRNLDQSLVPGGGGSWCGPTAVGIGLSSFADADPLFANLVPDVNQDGIGDDDRYAAIEALGTTMSTDASGTTNGGLVRGTDSYIDAAGLGGNFRIKVFNRPYLSAYMGALEGGEAVAVRLGYIDADDFAEGDGHWLVGRSFGARNLNGTPDDPCDDTWPISFVDPGSGSVYHSHFLACRGIWYNGAWTYFDIMVSISPTDEPPNEDTAQYFVAQNEFFLESPVGDDPPQRIRADLAFTLLGNPDPASPEHRVLPLVGDQQGRIFVARITVRAVGEGTAHINFVSPGQDLSPVLVVGSADIGCTDNCPPPPSFLTPAAVIVVTGAPAASLSATITLQGAQRPNPDGWEGNAPSNAVPVTFRFFDEDSDVLDPNNATATYICQSMEKAQGDSFGTCNIPDVATGTFDITVMGPHTLTNVLRGVVITNGENTLNIGTLVDGDADENGSVNILDVGLLIGSWLQGCGDAGYNSNTDFDNNCSVNLLDVGIFVGAFRSSSPIETVAP